MLLVLRSCLYFPVDKTLHVSFDRYGLFAIVPAKDLAKRLATLLKQDLATRQETWNWLPNEGEPKRQYATLHPNEPLIRNVEFDLILLHPQQLLPGALPLLRHDPSDGTCAGYTLSPEMELKDAAGTIFPSFTYECTRQFYERPNIYCMILNARVKFSAFMGLHDITTSLSEDSRDAITRTLELAELITKRLVPPPGLLSDPTRSSSRQTHGVDYRDGSPEDMNGDSSEPGTPTAQSPDPSSRQFTSRIAV